MTADDRPKTESAPKKIPVSRLMRLALPEWRLLAPAMLFVGVGVVMTMVFPFMLGTIVDKALDTRDLTQVDTTVLLLFVIFAVQSVAFGLRYYFFSVAGERIVARLRETLYERIVSQEVAFFDQRKTGELTNRLSADTATLQGAATTSLSNFVRDIAIAVGMTVALFIQSPKLTGVMLALVPPAVLMSIVFGRRIEKLARDVQDALAEAGSTAQESISGIRTVRAFARERAALRDYSSAIWKAFRLSRRHRVNVSVLVTLSSLVASGALCAVVWYGGRLVVTEQMSTGNLVAFVAATMTVVFTMGLLSDTWSQLKAAAGAASNVFGLIDRTPAIPIVGGAAPEHAAGHVTLERVHFAYPSRGDVPVLHGVDLDLAPGSIVALVGPSGSGKSTVAGLIPRFYDPDEGRVLLDGRDLRELDPTWLREQVGIVAQEPILFSASVSENIRYGRTDATDAEVREAALAAYAHRFVQDFPEGYDTYVGERGLQLSAGQKQRIAIARAVLKDPRILILDEATSALDAESEHLVKEALDRLMEGRTTLVIAHRLSTVRHAHRVVVIEHGRVVQSGSHDALMDDPEGLYHRLVQKQFLAT